MGKPHTTIGAERFHFRVRKGIGWFPLAIAARKTGFARSYRAISNLEISDNLSFIYKRRITCRIQAKTLWRYMIKPHVQLVLVSFTHYCASTPSLSTS